MEWLRICFLGILTLNFTGTYFSAAVNCGLITMGDLLFYIWCARITCWPRFPWGVTFNPCGKMQDANNQITNTKNSMIGMAGYGVTNISDRYVLLLLSITVSSSSRSQATWEIWDENWFRIRFREQPLFLHHKKISWTVMAARVRPSAENLHKRPPILNSHCDSG